MTFRTSTHHTPAAAVPDADLMRRAASGDEAAFRMVYDRHLDAIRGYALGRVGPDAADDVASETFSTAWRMCGRFDPEATSARPWLYGIATNVVARHRDREQRWIEQRERRDAERPQSVEEPSAYELDPALAKAIARLSPSLRDTLLLTALADLTVAETGRALGITATTARVRLLRARRLVRQSLEGKRHDRS